MEKEDLIRLALGKIVRGKPHSEIANELGITRDELNGLISEIREGAAKAITEDEIKFYLMDTLITFSELERTAWNEFENVTNPTVRANLIKTIASLRKDSLDVRKEFEVLAPHKKKEIPYQKIEQLGEVVRLEISKRAMKHLESLEALPEPEPFTVHEGTGQPEGTVIEFKPDDEETG